MYVNNHIDLRWASKCDDVISRYICEKEKNEVINTLIEEGLLPIGTQNNNVNMLVLNDNTNTVEESQTVVFKQISSESRCQVVMESIARSN